jgi:hypothetical protein
MIFKAIYTYSSIWTFQYCLEKAASSSKNVHSEWDCMKFSPHFEIASLNVKQNKMTMSRSFLSPLAWMAFWNTWTWPLGLVHTLYMGWGSDFKLGGVTGGRPGATSYQGRYHVIHSGPIQGPPMGVVMARVTRLGGFPPPLDDLTPIFTLFELKTSRNTRSHAQVEWLGPLGCPLLEGPENPSFASSRPPPPTLTIAITGGATFAGIIFGQPHPSVATGLPLDTVVPSWASKVAWKPVWKKCHSIPGKEEDFLWGSKILEIHPYFPWYPGVNQNFLVQDLGN